MRLPQPRERAPEENVVPLINIVFLLLIFFMIAGTLTPADPFEVDPPDAVTGEDVTPEPVRILLSPQGAVAVNGKEIGWEEVADRVRGVLDADPAREVEVKADGGMDSGRLLDLMEDLRAAGVERMTLVTRREY